MYVVVLATDGLRLANKYAGQRVFEWQFLSDRLEPVESSNGVHVDCDVALPDAARLDYAFVVAGDDQNRKLTPAMRNWFVTMLGAIDSGTFTLAEAKLIRGRSVTIHPMSAPAFREEFPGATLSGENVTIDRSLITCAGGLATVELVLWLIEQHCGPVIAQHVASDMVMADQMSSRHRRQASTRNTEQADLHSLLQVMQSNLETPLSLPKLSALLRLSERQVSRIFQQRFGQSPMAYYRMLRLTHAKQLLFQSKRSISEIAIASGFQSVSAFSRCFTAEFGRSPRQQLKLLHERGNAEYVPEHHLRKRVKLRKS
jgi:AraC family carnitine catabolism transcriptional activator